MDIDKLQVFALCLEITGFSIAIIHVFIKDFYDLIQTNLKAFLTKAHFFNLDFEISIGEKKSPDYIDNSSRIIIRLILILFYFNLISFEKSGILIWIGKLFLASFLSLISTYIVHALLLLLIKIIEKFFSISGKGDFVVGIGFVLSFLGLLIETYQVYLSTFYWTIFLIWPIGLLGIVIVAYLMRKKRAAIKAEEENNEG